MARPGPALLDWQLFSNAGRIDAAVPVWSRFPVELAPDLIVSPHLFDWPRESSVGHDMFTCARTPLLMVFCGRGGHLRFLRDELVPSVMRHGHRVVLIDGDASRFAVDGENEWAEISALGPILRAAFGGEEPQAQNRFGHLLEALSGKADTFERELFVREEVAPGHVERLERHPIRLWEALFWRGHAYRYELVEGEVPLVGNLLTPLAANRTLMQLLKDAVALEGTQPLEERGFIRCGRFRFQQEGPLVHIRVRLDPADVRAAFMPQGRVEGDSQLPSLVGVLMAGGDNGKTELIHGFSWSVAITDGQAEAHELARKLQREIGDWVGATATLVDGDFALPKEPRNEWFLYVYERYVTVYVPFHRERCLPWDVHAEDYWIPLNSR